LEGGEPPEVERVFLQFSNLFAYDPEEDDDGVHEGNRWITLPRHALNIRIGKMEPQVFNHAISGHARIGVQTGLAVRQRIGDNRFRFEPSQNVIEANGIIHQNNSYVIGFANGGNSGQVEDNNHKDVYYRVSRKWFGYPLDGVIGSTELVENDAVRGQSPDEDDSIFTLPGLDFWRGWDLETGVFGWWGLSEISDGGISRNDYFRRNGVDVRLQWFNWDIYGLAYWGHDSFAGRVGGVDLGVEDHQSYMIQTDYYWKPWIVSYLRYEETVFDKLVRASSEEGRVIPGVNFLIRQNLKLQVEWDIDTTGKDTGGGQATDQLVFQLDYTF